ncbi:MAG TPA: VWA domain-containing protein [Polyangiaceae bacterium]|jgi:Ca-activated chloride channel family protein|nr:VWA domain-containing protein [Polyangiaceae bacterium]
MRFAEPYWLIIGAIAVTALVALRIRGEFLTTRALRELAGARLLNARALPSRLRRWTRVVLACSAVALGFVALARPERGMRWETLDRKGTDLLLVLDTSKSMNADDVAPTRLERTKLAVRDLVKRFPGDRIGLVAFAGDAFLESPMTLDHDALLETLAATDTSAIGRPGTDIGRAIDSATAALRAESGSQKVMVLLTDGEDLQGQGLEAARRAAAEGVTIETIGVGTPAGELVPETDEQGVTTGVVRDENGAAVRSRLDESGLRAIAQAAHGTYRPLGADGLGLERLYSESLAPLTHVEHGARVRRVYAEWFAVPLSLSLVAVVLDALLGWMPRKRRARSRSGRRSTSASGAVAAATVVALFSGTAAASVQSAQKAYEAGHFEDSSKAYEAARASAPKDARLAIDAGAAAYRAKHYDAAEAALTHALGLAAPTLQERVLYDLGDARYRIGGTTLKDAPEKTIERWKSAIEAYEGALKLSPKDADAHFNRDFVKRKLAELENQQKEKQQQQQQQQQQGGQPKQGQKNNGNSNDKSDQAGEQSAQNKAGEGNDRNAAKKPDQNGKDQNGKNPATPPPRTPGNAGDKAQGQQDKPGGTSPDKLPGQTKDGEKPDGTQQAGDRKPGTEPGKLSPEEARALLDSLRGEERRAVHAGNSKAQTGDEAPRKDW